MKLLNFVNEKYIPEVNVILFYEAITGITPIYWYL